MGSFVETVLSPSGQVGGGGPIFLFVIKPVASCHLDVGTLFPAEGLIVSNKSSTSHHVELWRHVTRLEAEYKCDLP